MLELYDFFVNQVPDGVSLVNLTLPSAWELREGATTEARRNRDRIVDLFRGFLVSGSQHQRDGARAGRERAFFGTLFGSRMGRLYRRKLRKGPTDALREEQKYYPGTTCAIGQRKLFVTTQGNLYPCERIETREGARIGHVDTGVDTDRAYAILNEYAETAKEDCRSCWALSICPTSCVALVITDEGVCAKKKRHQCALGKQNALDEMAVVVSALRESPGCLDAMYPAAESQEAKRPNASTEDKPALPEV